MPTGVLNALMTYIYQEAKDFPRKIAATALRSIAKNVTIYHEGQHITLEEYAQDWVEDYAPYLEGSSIYENPAEAVAYLLIFPDKDYIFNELKIIKTDDGKSIAITEAIMATSKLKVDNVESLLEILDCYETFTDEAITLDDVDAAAVLLENSLVNLN